MSSRKGGLGKGLDALFVDNDTGGASALTLRISEIEPNRSQPRKDFDEGTLGDLADSIRQHGVLQPLLVRPLPTGGYQIVAGERRWRAARMAGLVEVPVVIREMDDQETMEVALIENLQREDLNPIEEALGYKLLAEQHQMTQEEIAKGVGKSRPVVANALRLLNLPQQVVDMVRKDEITVGHARALLSFTEELRLIETAKNILKQHLTVRDVEKLASMEKVFQEKPQAKPLTRDIFYEEVELAATNELGRKIKINQKKDKGTLVIEFYDKEDLAGIMEKITGERLRW